jgi:hypothetical protein
VHCRLLTLGMHDVCSRHDAGYGLKDRLPGLIDEEVRAPSSGVFYPRAVDGGAQTVEQQSPRMSAPAVLRQDSPSHDVVVKPRVWRSNTN